MAFKGIDVKLTTKHKTGETDAFGTPVFSLMTETVSNVLVAPLSSDDAPSNIDLSTYKELYTLAIPKMDNHTWKGGIVEFWGKKWRVVGVPLEGIEALIPLDWNKKVTVERYE